MSEPYQGTDGFDHVRGMPTGLDDIEERLDDAEWSVGGQHAERPDPDPISLEPGQEVPAGDAGPFTEPDTSALGSATRPRGAVTYQRRLRAVFAKAIKITATRPSTVADSATLFLYSPKVAEALGDLAAKDPRVARGIDLLTDGTDNPYLDAAFALLPLVTQLARNHEPLVQPQVRGFRIPFLMKTPFRLPFKIGLRLNGLRAVTYEPNSVTAHVFGDPAVRAAFEKQKVPIAWKPRR